MKLLIRNLSRTTTEAELRELFEGYGTVQSCNIVLDAKTRESKGFGFAEIPKAGEAKAAMQAINGSTIDGNIVRVKKASPKPTTESAAKSAQVDDQTANKVTNPTTDKTAS